MSLTYIDPKTSKIAGNVNIDAYGNNFIETAYDHLPSLDISTDSSTTHGTVSELTEGLELHVADTQAGQASVVLDKVFGEGYHLAVDFSRLPHSFPSVDRARTIGIECLNSGDMTKKVRIFLEYRENQGHLAVIETWDNSLVSDRSQISINPYDIAGIEIIACGKYIHGCLKKNDGTRIMIGRSEKTGYLASRVFLFAENVKPGVSRDLAVLITKVYLEPSISFAGYPGKIILLENNRIKAKTSSGEISLGDVIYSGANGTISKLENGFRYVKGIGVGKVIKKFDTVQAVYAEYVNPPREKLFESNKGFIWDEDFLLAESQKNNNLFVPSLWNPTTGNIPADFFQSGIGGDNALRLKGIERSTVQDEEKWHAKIEHGNYFIRNVPYYLFSDESVVDYLGELKTEDGRSKYNLIFPPKKGIPIVASLLAQEPETKRTIEVKRITKKGRFTGKVVNGIELETLDTPENIDQTKEEFVVKYNSNNQVRNWRIPTEGAAVGYYRFELPEQALMDFKLRFSRKDIFKTEKTIAKKYDEGIYDTFLYGDGITEVGDYAVSFSENYVEVILDRDYKDLGMLSYTFDYPAVIEFNKDYNVDRGSGITDPTFRDLDDLDDLGESNGMPNQKFRFEEYPAIDTSTQVFLDTTNIKIFVYDEFDNFFDTSWFRVRDVSVLGPNDKGYEFDAASGLIRFGDGVNGAIPNKYWKILAGYKPTLKIQYEPESSNDFWTAKTIDLNLSKSTLNSGFIFLSRKELIPSNITVEFSSKEINAFETTDFYGTVYTQEGEVVSDTNVHFEIVEGGGSFSDQNQITNPNGRVSTIYTPSNLIEDIGIKVDLYDEGVDSDTWGAQNASAFGMQNGVPYMNMKATEPIEGELEDIYVFKILDDGDGFLPYDAQHRQGGKLILLHDEDPVNPEPLRPTYIAGDTLGFGRQLPQSHDPLGPNYEKDLVGFFIVAKKTIQARAYIDTDEFTIYSDIVNVKVKYSPLQKGTWTLPIPPALFDSSQINTATYMDIDN